MINFLGRHFNLEGLTFNVRKAQAAHVRANISGLFLLRQWTETPTSLLRLWLCPSLGETISNIGHQ